MDLWKLYTMSIPISLITAGIKIIEKEDMFFLDSYIYKLGNKYTKRIDKSSYCRFEGIERIKTGTCLMIILLISYVFDLNTNTFLNILLICGAIDILRYHMRRKKFIDEQPSLFTKQS